jgi:hypothetical protein
VSANPFPSSLPRSAPASPTAATAAGCVVGPGLVGSYLGALGGLEAVVCGPSGGLAARMVRSPNGGMALWRPRQVAPSVRLVADRKPLLVATRSHQTPAWLRPATTALAAQNGLGDTLPVVVCYLAITRDRTGMLRHLGADGCPPRVVVGPVDPVWQPVLAAWRRAGIDVEQTTDIASHRWQKAILNATVGPLCLVHGGDMARIWRDPALQSLVRSATAEGAALAAAQGYACASSLPSLAERFFAAVGPHRPSLLRDPGELDDLLPLILRRAAGLGIPCPHLQAIHDAARRAVTGASVDPDHDHLGANA